MNLTNLERAWLRQIGVGIESAESFIVALSDYRGDAITTEYILTVDIAKALFSYGCADVQVEFLIHKIPHGLIREGDKQFELGGQRFDVVVIENLAPKFITEVKIRVTSLGPELRKDLKKIIGYLSYIKCAIAKNMLGVCVFQVHVEALKALDVIGTTTRVHELERKILGELQQFAKNYPDFEFGWIEFQSQEGRIYDDERIEDVDGSPTLGRRGYACRYHAIVVRRHCGASPSSEVTSVGVSPEKDSLVD